MASRIVSSLTVMIPSRNFWHKEKVIEIEEQENELIIYTKFAGFGSMQKALEEKKINIMSKKSLDYTKILIKLLKIMMAL